MNEPQRPKRPESTRLLFSGSLELCQMTANQMGITFEREGRVIVENKLPPAVHKHMAKQDPATVQIAVYLDDGDDPRMDALLGKFRDGHWELSIKRSPSDAEMMDWLEKDLEFLFGVEGEGGPW